MVQSNATVTGMIGTRVIKGKEQEIFLADIDIRFLVDIALTT